MVERLGDILATVRAEDLGANSRCAGHSWKSPNEGGSGGGSGRRGRRCRGHLHMRERMVGQLKRACLRGALLSEGGGYTESWKSVCGPGLLADGGEVLESSRSVEMETLRVASRSPLSQAALDGSLRHSRSPPRWSRHHRFSTISTACQTVDSRSRWRRGPAPTPSLPSVDRPWTPSAPRPPASLLADAPCLELSTLKAASQETWRHPLRSVHMAMDLSTTAGYAVCETHFWKWHSSALVPMNIRIAQLTNSNTYMI